MAKKPGFTEEFDEHVEAQNKKMREENADKRHSELLAKFPVPTTMAQAESFFRDLEKTKGIDYSIDATFKIKRGYDVLRVVLKNKDPDVCKVKWERTVDLDLKDPEEYDRLYINTAAQAHEQWLRSEIGKY